MNVVRLPALEGALRVMNEGKEDCIKAINRRGFIGFMAGMAAMPLVGGGQAFAEEDFGTRIMPASTLAQSALLMFAPERLISLVHEVNDAEAPVKHPHVKSMRVTGRFSVDSMQEFEKAVCELQPDCILDVGLYSEDHWRSLEEMGDACQVQVVAVDISGLTVFGAMRAVCGLVADDIFVTKLEALDEMESLMASGIETMEGQDRYVVHLGESSRRCRGFPQKSPEHRMLEEACVVEWHDETGESMYNGSGPEVVICSSAAAWKGYLEKEHEQFDWTLTDASKCGCVLPGLVAGRQWIAEMSPFAKASLGALWLGNTFYPDAFKLDIRYVANLYYDVLVEGSEVRDKLAEEADEVIDGMRKRNRDEILEEQRLCLEERKRIAKDAIETLYAANNRKLTDDERRILAGLLGSASTVPIVVRVGGASGELDVTDDG